MIKIEERIRELSDDPEYQGQRMKILKIIRDEYDIKLEEAKKLLMKFWMIKIWELYHIQTSIMP